MICLGRTPVDITNVRFGKLVAVKYVNGKWLHIDVTWDDPISDTNQNRDTYFLIDTKTLGNLDDKTHNFDKSIYKEAA